MPGKIIATRTLVLAALAAIALQGCGQSGGTASGAPDISAPGIPHDVPKAAAKAMKLAQKWHADAQLIELSIAQSNNYAIAFMFRSPSNAGFFDVTDTNGSFTSQAMGPVTTSALPDALPLQFLDLPAAIAKAEQQGMPNMIKQAELQASHTGKPALSWAIQPVTEDAPYLYTVDAVTGAVSHGDAWDPSQDPNNERTVNRPK